MSFLNALASSGLSVGLRLANYYPQVNKSEAGDFCPAEVPECRAAPEPMATPEPRAVRPDREPLSPEERAAGRAEAKAQLAAEGCLGRLGCAASGTEPAESEEKARETAGASGGPVQGPLKELTPEEEAQVRKMAQRDQEVKAHEQAHVAASGGLAGAPKYSYQTGPDGRQYAVGGEVSIRRSGGGGNTDQAIAEAETVKRGATAPAQPSSQDMAVAARAEADIQSLKAKKAQEEGTNKGEGEEAGFSQGLANGSAFGSQVAGAYAAVKLGFQSAVRPLLARA
ncbi:MAG: hypothetical protein FWG97_04170 [Deltaproteobacteria bacterium]|nr:hypothetical protein [Deltaproteobacteria bacterium]